MKNIITSIKALTITTDMVMKNIITSIKDLTTLMMIIYLQFTNCGRRGLILMITTDRFWQESVAQDVVKRSYLHLSPPLSLLVGLSCRTGGSQDTRTPGQLARTWSRC